MFMPAILFRLYAKNSPGADIYIDPSKIMASREHDGDPDNATLLYMVDGTVFTVDGALVDTNNTIVLMFETYLMNYYIGSGGYAQRSAPSGPQGGPPAQGSNIQ